MSLLPPSTNWLTYTTTQRLVNKNLRWGVCLAYKHALDHIKDNLLQEGCLLLVKKDGGSVERNQYRRLAAKIYT